MLAYTWKAVVRWSEPFLIFAERMSAFTVALDLGWQLRRKLENLESQCQTTVANVSSTEAALVINLDTARLRAN